MRIYIFAILFLSLNTVICQNSAWPTLAMVTSTTSYDAAFGIETKKVKVSSVVKALQGKEIELEGYIIPLTGKLAQNHFMLSKYNEKMCFFCGKAGPETAIQVFLANGKKRAYTDEKIKVKGILRINEDEVTGLLYTLDEAVLIE